VFGKRSGSESDTRAIKPAAEAPEAVANAAPAAAAHSVASPTVSSPPIAPAKPVPPPAVVADARLSENYYEVSNHFRRADRGDRSRPALQARQRERERLAKTDKVSLRQTPKQVVSKLVEDFNLGKWLAQEAARDKLIMAGYRGQAPHITFLVARLSRCRADCPSR
jgi:hypothetical protein